MYNREIPFKKYQNIDFGKILSCVVIKIFKRHRTSQNKIFSKIPPSVLEFSAATLHDQLV
jgi:hypothetical protein